MVQGIGGICIYARDPRRLAEWYQVHLGLEPRYVSEADAYCHDFFLGDLGDPSRRLRVCWSIHPSSRDTPAHPMRIRYRVNNLDLMLARLRASGVEVSGTDCMPNGRLSRVNDPEGNTVELFEDHEQISRPNVQVF